MGQANWDTGAQSLEEMATSVEEKTQITQEQFDKITDLQAQIQKVSENADTSSLSVWLSEQAAGLDKANG